MKKIVFTFLSTLLAMSSLLFMNVRAEESGESTQNPEVTSTVQTAEDATATDGTTLYTDKETIEEVNDKLAETETYEVADGIDVNKDEDGVTVGVTGTGDLQIHITDPGTLQEIDAQQNSESQEPILTEEGTSDPVVSEPEEGTLLEYSLVIPEEQIDAFIGAEEDINTTASETSTSTETSTMEAQWGSGLYLKKKTSYYDTGDTIRVSSYQGPAEAKMAVSDSVAYTFSGTAGMDVKTIAYELGFQYQKTKTVSDEYAVTVPKGKTYRIYAKEYNKIYNYEVWNDPFIGGDYKESNGKAKRPMGIAFSKRTI